MNYPVHRVIVGDVGPRHVLAELALPALMLREQGLPASEYVHVYVPSGPTVAFSSRDARSPSFERAIDTARDLGFTPAVRGPGGSMVAYDEGAVIVDHIDLSGRPSAAQSVFVYHARTHARLLRGLGLPDVRVGEVMGEYCPGEHSLNVGGLVKVAGSAQRIAGRGAHFSTVVQVQMSDRVREAICATSHALGRHVEQSSIGGLTDFAPTLTTAGVAALFTQSHLEGRTNTARGWLPGTVLDRTMEAHTSALVTVFDANEWARDHFDST